jgi:hypothetical protein
MKIIGLNLESELRMLEVVIALLYTYMSIKWQERLYTVRK